LHFVCLSVNAGEQEVIFASVASRMALYESDYYFLVVVVVVVVISAK